MDWSQCSLVEITPHIHSGDPVLRGTRLPVSAIVDNYDYGVSAAEISQLFEVPQEQVEAILSYAESRRVADSIR